MEKSVFSRTLLNRSLRIFFKNALYITLRNPFQAFTFIRTIFWLKRSANVREKLRLEGYLIPSILIFSITNKCNLNCKGCYNKSFHTSGNKELSDEKLWQITEEAKRLGVSFFVISGGEPFLRPVLLDIMKEYPEIIFLVFTNGTLINEKMIGRFNKQKNVVPLISLEGNREETDERRGQGTFDKLIQTMMQYYRSTYSSLFIAVPWDQSDAGDCLSAGRGFVHINATGDLEPCPFAPFSDTNVRDYSLKDALQSKLCEKIRRTPELSKEKGDGCVLWKERELVASLLENQDT